VGLFFLFLLFSAANVIRRSFPDDSLRYILFGNNPPIKISAKAREGKSERKKDISVQASVHSAMRSLVISEPEAEYPTPSVGAWGMWQSFHGP